MTTNAREIEAQFADFLAAWHASGLEVSRARELAPFAANAEWARNSSLLGKELARHRNCPLLAPDGAVYEISLATMHDGYQRWRLRQRRAATIAHSPETDPDHQ